MATPDSNHWKEVEQNIVIILSHRYGVSENSAKDIINMVSSLCSTRGAALMWIEKYLNNHG